MSDDRGTTALDPELELLVAECLVCLHDPAADDAQRQRWVAWLNADPERRRRYSEQQRIWSSSLVAGRLRMPDAAELAADDDDADLPLSVPARSVPARPPRLRAARRSLSWRPVAGAALAASTLLAALLLWQDPPAAPEGPAIAFSTGTGEGRVERLEDGSTVTLAAGTDLSVRMSAAGRAVTLRSGQALFQVAPDKQRPFTVTTSDGEARAVGTAFDVRKGTVGTAVTVVEGVVMVRPAPDGSSAQPQAARLQAGQQVQVDRGVGAIRKVDPVTVTGWMRGRLSYVDQPLREVLADLQRYSQKKVTLSPSSMGDLRYTGTVFVSEIEGWASSLPRVYPVRVSSTANEIRIRPRELAE
jgi:transmembrane sensor